MWAFGFWVLMLWIVPVIGVVADDVPSISLKCAGEIVPVCQSFFDCCKELSAEIKSPGVAGGLPTVSVPDGITVEALKQLVFLYEHMDGPPLFPIGLVAQCVNFDLGPERRYRVTWDALDRDVLCAVALLSVSDPFYSVIVFWLHRALVNKTFGGKWYWDYGDAARGELLAQLPTEIALDVISKFMHHDRPDDYMFGVWAKCGGFGERDFFAGWSGDSKRVFIRRGDGSGLMVLVEQDVSPGALLFEVGSQAAGVSLEVFGMSKARFFGLGSVVTWGHGFWAADRGRSRPDQGIITIDGLLLQKVKEKKFEKDDSLTDLMLALCTRFGGYNLCAAGISPDKRWIVLFCTDGLVKAWRIEPSRLVRYKRYMAARDHAPWRWQE